MGRLQWGYYLLDLDLFREWCNIARQMAYRDDAIRNEKQLFSSIASPSEFFVQQALGTYQMNAPSMKNFENK